MSLDNQTSTSTEPAAPDTNNAPEQPAPAAPAEAPKPAADPAADPIAAVAPAPYTPNLKYKVMDKEMEFDKFLHDVIKDQETEKKIRSLYEKATGLDYAKPKHEETRKSLETTQTELKTLTGALQDIGAMIKRKDFDGVFQELGIDQQSILRYAMDKVQYNELTPEQREAIDGKTEAERRAYFLEKQNREFQENLGQQALQARMSELDGVLAKDEIKPIITDYGTRVGRPEAFRELVVRVGQWAWHNQKVDLSADEAVQEALAIIGSQTQAPQPAAPAIVPAPVVGGKKAPPVIPAIVGRQTSPAANKPSTSIDDLKRKLQTLEDQRQQRA